MSLKDYHQKRNFLKTKEPKGKVKKTKKGPLKFVVQMHRASRLHYDFRLEVDGVLKSWAVPKGPTLDPSQQHLAVFVEDHPLEYGDFEGIIPSGNYGAGTVMVWDTGTYIERNSKNREESEAAILKGLQKRHITFILDGKKLKGEFALVGLKGEDGKAWLLIKKRDEFATRVPVENQDRSVKSGRNLQEIASEAPERKEIWIAQQKGDPNRKKVPLIPPRSIASQVDLPLQSEKMPRKNKPMLATPWSEPFEQKGWIYEIEYGGHRGIAEVEKGGVHLYSRQFLPYEKKYPDIVEALRNSKVNAVLDGEIFEEKFWVRDLLHLNGVSFRDLPLIERKKRLRDLPLFNSTVLYLEHESKCSTALAKAKNLGLKSVLARDAYSLYQAGTTKKWLRIPVEGKLEVQAPRLTHLKKILWPVEKISKGDLIEYYRKVAPVLVPLLKDYPQSMHRHPDGIAAPGFFHKDLQEHYPKYVQTERIYSASVGKSINYLLCQNENTLLYMVNLGCIEINPWLSRIGSLDRPDAVVIDLDPDETNAFSQVVEVAIEIHKILERVGAPHLCKTSGSTGIHFYIPTGAQYDYPIARKFAESVCQVILSLFPKWTSLDRNPSKRRGRIYLDCYQNAQGQTVVAPYSVRPKPGAPVSTPLQWKELNFKLDPHDFTIFNVPKRIEKLGDLWRQRWDKRLNLDICLSSLRKNFPIPPK